ncbi:MAG TPA: serpin family protein [Candidatus Acidoferrales bacterium]|nr:serpin family protein [Candidatus Acidoferrales bacterium]
MKRSRTIFFLGVIVAVIMTNFGCSHVTSPGNNPNPNPNPLPISPIEKQVESATNSFAANLFGQVAAQEKGENFFISPLSVSMALAMTLNGANGKTYDDMQKTLGLSGLTNDEINQSYQSLITMFSNLDPNVTFNIANSIWYRNTFQVISSFLTTDSVYYNADVRPLNFSDPNAANVVNSWVSDKTNGKIPDVISPPIDPGTMMYLINALYFNGTWKYEFDSANTEDKPFALLSGTNENVPTMMVHDTVMKYYSDSSFTAVELPYGSGDYSMLVLLPNGSSSFSDAEVSLTQTEVNNIIDGLSEQDVVVSLPKFKVEYKTDLVRILTNLGMGSAFSGGADFTRINKTMPLQITGVLHKTYIDVNERGTEAAAVTVVTVGTTVVGPHIGPIYFTVDRPFIFLIKENHDNTIMFMGAVVDPTASSQN